MVNLLISSVQCMQRAWSIENMLVCCCLLFVCLIVVFVGLLYRVFADDLCESIFTVLCFFVFMRDFIIYFIQIPRTVFFSLPISRLSRFDELAVFADMFMCV